MVERVAGAPRVDVGDPLVVSRGGAVLLEHLEHAGDDTLQIAHNGHIGIADLPDLRRVDVDVHDLRVGGELGDASGDPVGEARAGGDDEVGLGHGHVRVLRPVHAHRPQVQRMARGHAALAHEGDDGGNAHLVHEGHNLVGCLRRDDAAADVEQRLFRLFQKAAGGANLLGVAAVGGLVGGQVHRIRVLEHHGLAGHVARDVDEHGTGAPRDGDVEGLADGAGELVGGLQQVGVLDHGHRDAHDVGFLGTSRCR